MKVLVLILFASLILTAKTLAADSTWLLCNSDSLVLNVLEHRAVNGDDRINEYAMIYGMHVLKGSQKSSTTRARLNGAKNYKFRGRIDMVWEANLARVTGVLTLDGQPEIVRADLRCKLMDNSGS